MRRIHHVPEVSRDAVMTVLREMSTHECIKKWGFQQLLSIDKDPKTAKSNKGGVYLTAIQYLYPGAICEWATKDCLRVCLNTAGTPWQLPGKLKARKARTRLLTTDPVRYMARLVFELRRFVAKCEMLGVKPVVRLNGTSDIDWERVAPWLFKMFPHVKFYDYTKGFCRLYRTLPKNYWLTFSRSGENDFEVGVALARGFHVAIVMNCANKNRPTTWNGYRTENGDKDDLIFARKNPVQVLYPKGKARKTKSRFIVELNVVQ